MQNPVKPEYSISDEMPDVPIGWTSTSSSLIKVVGVGGGGCNAVSYMYRQGIHNVDFIICNTDAQALRKSPVPVQIRLGKDMTDGLGAGNKPAVGEAAARESADDIRAALDANTKMVFITAGMGGGTGTGAAPVIAKIAKDADILTVAIVTLPFQFEGSARYQQALRGIEALKDNVDALLVINNEKLREMCGNLPISQAFSRADDILTTAAKGIAELITNPGQVNVDFADVRTIMTQGGITIMGSAKAAGENRAGAAVEAALTSPLLNNNNITGASRILLNITSGVGDCEITMDEFEEITAYVQHAVSKDALIVWGTGTDEALNETGELSVTIVATHFDTRFLSDELSGVGRKRISLDSEAGGTESPTVTFIQKQPSIDDIIGRPSGTAQAPARPAVRPRTGSPARAMDIDTLENVPAYIRKQQREKNVAAPEVAPEEVSDMTLNADGDYDVHLQEDNVYFSVPD